VSRSLIQICTLLAGLLLPAVAQAQFKFTTNSGAITITGYTGAGGAVIIPAATNGYPVGSIQYYTFLQSSLTSVIIPDSITNIGLQAFSDCTYLKNITVDAANPSYSSLDGVLFDKAQVTLLQFPAGLGGSYTLPTSVTTIGQYSFTYSASVTNIILLNSVTNIGQYAFYNCTGLANITLPNTLISIGGFAFGYCGLTNVIVPNSLSSIGASVFQNCSSLASVTIPNSVTSIGGDAFAMDSLMSAVMIPNSVTNIGNAAFAYCSSLTNITIGNGLISIGNSAFYSCTSLTSVTIPSRVTSIGYNAFGSCASLLAVYFQGNTPSLVPPVAYVFYGVNATIYYLPGTMGWGATFGGRPTMLWNPQAQTGDGSFGVQNNQFGFNITGSSNLVIVVEAAMNLSNPVWSPVATNTLNTFTGTNGTSYFSDPQWTYFPGRFYRLRSP
jgi:hypothetical protein